MPMKNVVISNSHFRADTVIELKHGDGLTLKNVRITTPGEQIKQGEGVKNVNVQP
ncbi:MAG: hypothetical protein K2M71_05165 [Duncaniella sp.]|nr:hypothetical protein [Duncaniella sp.]